MKVITIESEDYKSMMRKIDRIEMYLKKWQEEREEKKIKKNPNRDYAGELLHNDEVADMLEISLRTLQRLRSTGEITFSILCGRARYKLDDVQKFIQRQVVKSKYESEEELIRAHREYRARRKANFQSRKEQNNRKDS